MTKIFDPLTFRYPRTLAETQDQRFAWWTSAWTAANDEQMLRAQFSPAKRGICALLLRAAASLVAMFLLMAAMQWCGGGVA